VGAYFLVVNPVKRQFLDPDRFGESSKFSTVLRGGYCIQALKLLIADCFRQESNSFRGAWLCDPVILASDDTGNPDLSGIGAMTQSERSHNLYALARAEFADISYRGLAELCLDSNTAKALLALSEKDVHLLLDLGSILEQYQVPALEMAYVASKGQPWRKAHNQAQSTEPQWSPLPRIDWPM
jgi:hypothetical protein